MTEVSYIEKNLQTLHFFFPTCEISGYVFFRLRSSQWFELGGAQLKKNQNNNK